MAANDILVNFERCTGCWTCAFSCKVGHGMADDDWRVVARTLGSGEGIDKPAGTWGDLHMEWMPVGLQSGLYYFTDLMGPKIDKAPLSIGLSWMAVFYMGWFMANLVCDGAPSPRRNSIPRIIVKALVAAFIVSATDLAADPVSVEGGLWVWYDGGPFFGVPYSNYIGWIIVGTVILSVIGIVNKSNCDKSIDFAALGPQLLSIVPLLCFGLLGIGFIVQNYAGVMGIIELYAMGATFLIALVKWVDWVR